MNITLKMKIQDQEFRLEANLTNRAGRIYRQQFGRDLIRDMSEIYKKLHKSPLEGIDLSGVSFKGKTEEEIYDQILSNVDVGKLVSGQSDNTLDFEEDERGGQIIWAFVKNQDDKTPNYEEWIDSFDFVLPVGDIVSALYEAWTNAARPTIELKN